MSVTGLLTKMFGNKHDRDIKKIAPIVEEINAVSGTLHGLSDEELKARTGAFRTKLAEETAALREDLAEMQKRLLAPMSTEERTALMEEVGETEREIKEIEAEILDEITPEAYAVVKEVCRRFRDRGLTFDRAGEQVTWREVPYDVQLIGGSVLHQGKIAEMATGEGKTLVASMPIYLNALTGRGVHLVTVNNYLARRDATWVGPIYLFLGLTVGIIQDRRVEPADAYLLAQEGETFKLIPCEHQDAYAADITYGSKDQFGFDYLYDNMAVRVEDIMQRGHNFAIVDEADSILIDEARTPLIISGPVPESTHRYEEMKPLVQKLVRRQAEVVNRTLAEAERMMEEKKDDYETGIKLLQVQRGAPRNRRFMKLLQEEGIKKLITRVELDYLRDKRMAEIDEPLYYSVDERSHVVDLTERGRASLSPEEQDAFVLPDLSVDLQQIEEDPTLSDDEKVKRQDEAHRAYALKSEAIHNVHQLLKAYALYEKDVQYIVDGGRVVIINEYTGRAQPGHRYSDGLHQAIEAKENVQIEQETQTIATVTLQNYFRLYDKLAGMTGTAETESAELFEIYKLDVTVIPTNQPVRRIDYDDFIFKTKREKYNAIVEEVARLHEKGIPALVGTISVEVSELLSRLLDRRGIRHNVLNARYHQQEAQIVARAGQSGAVTIATNMAGRGTDIKLGAGVVKAPEGHYCALVSNSKDPRPLCPHLKEYTCREDVPCGLHIIGTERHEARRIDRQLRGRSGRQGDPGSSRFFISLEDDLMRLFGSDRIASIMDRLGAEEGEVIEHSMVTKSISRAQRRVEARNFEMRKHLLEYDDVMNQQREVVYDRRRYALEQADLSDQIQEMIDEVVEAIVDAQTNEEDHPEGWNIEGLKADLRGVFLVAPTFQGEDAQFTRVEDLKERVKAVIRDAYARRERAFGAEQMRQVERGVTLSVIDDKWKEHLYNMDELKEGISFRAYGQRDPLVEYKKEAFNMFVGLLDEINRETLRVLFRIPVAEEAPQRLSHRRVPERITAIHQEVVGFGAAPEVPSRGEMTTNAPEEGPAVVQPVRVGPKVGRNDPCPCGSGKKYKKCHGKGAA